MSSASTATTTHPHVLDPLAAAEIASFVAAVRASDRIGARPRFWGISLDEEKARGVAPGGARPVRLVVLDPDARAAWEVRGWTAGPDSPAIVEVWTDVDHRRPGVSSDEARLIAEAARNSPLLKEALALRGITDTSLVWVDPESITGFVPDDLADRRLSWGTVWYREFPEDNGYARPVAGLVPILDLDTLEVIRIEDHGVIPMASETGVYTAGTWGPDREVSKLDIVQADGPGFAIEGHRVEWQNWSFRVGFSHREGLVLHELTYRDGDVERPVLARAAVNEMYVPYLDSDPTAYRKNFFDWGEYGAGPLTASLELGCDCLGEIRYFDVDYLDGHGEPQTIVNGICLHEEDDSILWKHVNTRTGSAEVRRSRRLVISSFATVANYDYGFYWSLYQDGSVELEVKLTGLMSVSGIADGESPRSGRMVAPNVQAPIHQHYFAVRLDTAIDGPLNRLVEVHAEADPDETTNPYGNACLAVETPLASESVAARRADPSRALHWRIESESAQNRYGEATAYRLALQNTAQLYARPGSVVERKAPFVGQHLWASAFDPEQRFIAGEYPNQGELGDDGVHVWQQADRSLEDERLVLWPVLGVHHFPRPEQWPIMPVDRISLRLEPDGFFDRNPSLDVPASESAHCAPGAGGSGSAGDAHACHTDAASDAHAGHEHAEQQHGHEGGR
ncbi:primary-amine oxidase [Rathayibacter sp. PhB127]|uniref:primary-amine oxidase n=1 Tax=Rathayibacter sp. PhB127 TaxID=2485176 RepID=UPI000F4BACA7|nr:primary-amine oxidase [Rathayibacter sp. PhB127]ROS23537.1 primary-amine oxidase [Rathayibacter sp. PhB127]